MGLSTLKKRYCLTALILVLFVSSLFLIIGIFPVEVKAEKYVTGATVELGYSFDFTDYTLKNGSYSGNSASWFNDVYESDNMRLSSDTNVASLAPGSGTEVIDQQTVNEGYLIYKVKAGNAEGGNTKVFGNLTLSTNGRIFHYSHSECTQCKMQVSVALGDGIYNEVKTVYADENGSPLARSFDLTDIVSGEEYCFIKLVFVGYADAWVNLLNLSVEGSSYYLGHDPVTIEIENDKKGAVVSLNDEITIKSATATNGTDVFVPVVAVYGPDGEQVAVAENKFTAEVIGRYTIVYTVDDEGRIYTESYDLFCVKDSSTKGLATGKYGKYENSYVIDESNYTVSDGSEVYSDGSAVEIVGSAGYNLPLDFSGNVTVVFNINRFYEGETFGFSITSASGIIESGNYEKTGLYFSVSSETVDNVLKYYLNGYFKSDSTLRQLGKFEISTVAGMHYIHFISDGLNVVTAVFDGVDLSSESDFSLISVDSFSTEKKAYICYQVSDRADVEIFNIINFADFDGYDKSGIFDTDNYSTDGESSVTLRDNAVGITGSAAYLLPLDFSSAFNLVFNINALNAGATFEFALTSAPGSVNFDTKNVPGLYYLIKAERGTLLISGYFRSDTDVISLGQHGYDRVEGVHGFGIKKRIDQGVSTYFDGSEIFSYQNYSYVDLSAVTDGNNVYICYRTVKSEVEVTNLVTADGRSPVLTNPYTMTSFTRKTYPSTGTVGEVFVLPDAVMYDAVDGFMPYTVKVSDTNGNEVEVYTDSNGKLCFDILYEGLYNISYISVDFSGNSVTDSRNVTMSLKSGAPLMRFSASSTIESYGRQGKAIAIKRPVITVNGVRDEALEDQVVVKIYHPSGAYIEKKPDTSFTPFDIGYYVIIYEVKNETATTYAYFKVNVKMDADPEDSYTDIMDSGTWVTASDNLMEETEDGLLIYGEKGYTDTAYCKLPFEMTNGIEITLDISRLANKSIIDNWVSVGIGSTPKYGNFASPQSGYIYFMLYFQDGTYYVNAIYKSLEGASNGLFGPISLGDTGIVTLSVEKLLGSSTRTDNVNIYLNHQKTAYGTEDLITYSHLVDDENFSYISVHNYGNGSEGLSAKDFKAAIIKDVTVCDQEAPQFTISGEIVKEAKIGSTVTMPSITVSDNLDSNFVYSVMLVDPDGNEISYSGGSFVAEKHGSYYLVLRSYDKSGNYNIIINEIIVGNGSGCSGGFDVNGVIPLLTVLASCAFAIVARRLKKKN